MILLFGKKKENATQENSQQPEEVECAAPRGANPLFPPPSCNSTSWLYYELDAREDLRGHVWFYRRSCHHRGRQV